MRWRRNPIHTPTLSPLSLLLRVPGLHLQAHRAKGRRARIGDVSWTHTCVHFHVANLVLREQAVISLAAVGEGRVVGGRRALRWLRVSTPALQVPSAGRGRLL